KNYAVRRRYACISVELISLLSPLRARRKFDPLAFRGVGNPVRPCALNDYSAIVRRVRMDGGTKASRNLEQRARRPNCSVAPKLAQLLRLVRRFESVGNLFPWNVDVFACLKRRWEKSCRKSEMDRRTCHIHHVALLLVSDGFSNSVTNSGSNL